MMKWLSKLSMAKVFGALVLFDVFLMTSPAFAGGVSGGLGGLLGGGGGGNLPWDAPVNNVKASFLNTIAPGAVIVGIVIFGIYMGFSGEIQEGGRKIFGVVMGGAAAVGAPAVLSMFSSGGLVP
jgi:type IV secretory pathway VirB2 component (pilin)